MGWSNKGKLTWAKQWSSMALCLIVTVFCEISLAAPANAPAARDDAVLAPQGLAQWKGWLAQSNPKRECVAAAGEHCIWLGALALLEKEQGRWLASFEVVNFSAREERVYLPGSEESWPVEVKIDGAISAIGQGSGGVFAMVPARSKVRLDVDIDIGKSTSSRLAVPAGFAIARVKNIKGAERWVDPMQGVELSRPEDGSKTAGQNDVGAISRQPLVKISRLVEDAQIPLMTTKLKIENSDRRRAIAIDALLPAGSTLVQMTAPGAEFTAGTLRYEAPPGSSVISIVSRLPVDLDVKWSSPAGSGAVVEGSEFIFVKSDERVRKIAVSGKVIDPKAIDESLTYLGLPGYEKNKDSNLVLEVKPIERLGQETKAQVVSQAWLDFKGEEIFLLQKLNFEKARQGWFEPIPGWEATQAESAGFPAVVAKAENSDSGRISISEGLKQMTVGMRSSAGFSLSLPAVASNGIIGSSASTHLNLPLGWRVLAVVGDGYSDSGWLASMSLWDWFLLIVSAWGAKSLLGWRAACAVVGAMALGRLFAEAPFAIYLPMLGALALFRHLPDGGFRKAASITTTALFGAYLLVCAPFSMARIQKTMHVALEDQVQPSARDGLAGQWRTDRPYKQNEKPRIGATNAEPEPVGDEELLTGQARPVAPGPATAADGASIAESNAVRRTVESSSIVAERMQGRILSNKAAEPLPSKRGQAPVAGAQAGMGMPAWTTGTAVQIAHSEASSSKSLTRVILLSPALSKIASLLVLACIWIAMYFMVQHAKSSRDKENNIRIRSHGSAQASVS